MLLIRCVLHVEHYGCLPEMVGQSQCSSSAVSTPAHLVGIGAILASTGTSVASTARSDKLPGNAGAGAFAGMIVSAAEAYLAGAYQQRCHQVSRA